MTTQGVDASGVDERPARLSVIIGDLADAMARIGESGFPAHLARLLENAGSFGSAVIAAFPESGKPIRLFSNLSAEQEETTARPYFDGTYLLDPWYNMAQDHVADGVYRLADRVPDDFEQSEYYRGYYDATGLIDECGIFVRLSDNVCMIAMLGIRDGDGGPSHGMLDDLDLLFPCIRQLMSTHWIGLTTLPIAPDRNLTSLCRERGLVGREVEVTSHLLRGFSNKLIAREIGISPETVKVYRKRINKKLGTSSAREVFAAFFGAAGT